MPTEKIFKTLKQSLKNPPQLWVKAKPYLGTPLHKVFDYGPDVGVEPGEGGEEEEP